MQTHVDEIRRIVRTYYTREELHSACASTKRKTYTGAQADEREHIFTLLDLKGFAN